MKGFDAFAGKDAGIGPFARGLVAVTGAHDVDDAANDRGRILQLFGAKSAGRGDRTNLDAFAAARARFRHRLRARVQCGFEGQRRRIGPALRHVL